jgi:hypothetical protein
MVFIGSETQSDTLFKCAQTDAHLTQAPKVTRKRKQRKELDWSSETPSSVNSSAYGDLVLIV